MKHLRRSICLGLLLTSIGYSRPSLAQELESETLGYEFGAHLGNLLPNQVEDVTEITPQWGLRIGFPDTSANLVYELGAMTGRGDGAEWSNVSLSASMRYPIEDLTGIFYIGADAHTYQGPNQTERKTFGGGHIGGGIMTGIRNALSFRADMKFNINPGTSLYFGFGFLFKIPVEKDNQDQQ